MAISIAWDEDLTKPERWWWFDLLDDPVDDTLLIDDDDDDVGNDGVDEEDCPEAKILIGWPEGKEMLVVIGVEELVNEWVAWSVKECERFCKVYFAVVLGERIGQTKRLTMIDDDDSVDEICHKQIVWNVWEMLVLELKTKANWLTNINRERERNRNSCFGIDYVMIYWHSLIYIYEWMSIYPDTKLTNTNKQYT